jgi:protoheme IX farnesyltransferase
LKEALALAKPRITVLVALTSAAGYALATPTPMQWSRLCWMMLGVALASASTGCLNQVLESDHDALMVRTQRRPLPSGSISRSAAWCLGLAWGAAGLGILAWKVNVSSCALTALTLASYLLVYTPLKRVSSLSTWVGSIPGALPPVIGWAAAGGALDRRAGALFLIQVLWQMPHFFALAWMHRADYARGGFHVSPVVDPSGVSTARQMAVCSVLLLASSVLPFGLGFAGSVYLVGAVIAGTAFLYLSLQAARDLTDASARRVFAASLAYLPVILALLVIDRR